MIHSVGVLVIPQLNPFLREAYAYRPALRKFAVTDNQVRKGVSEEEKKVESGEGIGCFGWLMVALGLLIMLPTILISILTSF